jgi:glycosyltransferase involved in cell wall biosynthesis
VINIPFNGDYDTKVIKEEIAADNLDFYVEKMKAFDADIIHFHTLTTSIGFFHIKKSIELGYKVVLTSHIPGHICLRGDLVYMHREVCDGVIESLKCLSCYHHSKEIIYPFNYITAEMLKFGGYFFSSIDAAKNKKIRLLKLSSMLSAIIVVSGWQHVMFLANGVDSTKLRICRQAVFKSYSHLDRAPNEKLTLGFISRITQGKGLHLLLDALDQINPDLFNLNIAAIPVQDEISYFLEIKERALKYNNIRWRENVPNSEVDAFMANLDVLCIPSIWLETGPFVAYEAMANGIPVLGSNSGGINELIIENENGWLYEFNNADDLANKVKYLIELFKEHHALPFKDINVRNSKDLGNETIEIYQGIL